MRGFLFEDLSGETRLRGVVFEEDQEACCAAFLLCSVFWGDAQSGFVAMLLLGLGSGVWSMLECCDGDELDDEKQRARESILYMHEERLNGSIFCVPKDLMLSEDGRGYGVGALFGSCWYI